MVNNKVPCVNCENKTGNCHATCEVFHEWAKDKQRKKEKIRTDREKVDTDQMFKNMRRK